MNGGRLAQRSPSAPTFHSDSSPLVSYPSSISQQHVSRELSAGHPAGRKRSLSAEVNLGSSLRRGRPNTMWAGLPSPLHRRASDADRSAPWPLVLTETGPSVVTGQCTSVSVVDTSPIARIAGDDTVTGGKVSFEL